MSKILVVDDEVGIRERLREVLVGGGYKVTTVPSADQALATIQEQAYDLILLDDNVSGESGFTILSKIRELKKGVPVVICTGTVTPEIENQASKAGASAVLCKDIPGADLVKEVSKFVKVEAKPAVISEDVSASAAPQLAKTILIVDDEEEIRNVLIAFFKKKGYKTHQAENGEKALEVARVEDLSIVLLDIDMPVMDGLTTLGKLLEMKPDLCVVMVTGRQDDDKVKKALELGAYNYVLKPFEFLYLELVIKSKLESVK